MAELDKKNQKAETYLVQSVIEAHEKKNTERVDMLITNAIKQLKMSRFKPDQSTCYSLTYLARICPKVFQQSTPIKELLKSLIKRDNPPNAIKGAKNDIMLPVLSSNILLACCDGPEIRAIVLAKIEYWLANPSANLKGTTEMVQHLLAIICMKSQRGDQQTLSTLVDMRHHWIKYLKDNFETYGPAPKDLCIALRRLIHKEENCSALALCLDFLLKSDCDIVGLGQEVSKFILKRPIAYSSMLEHASDGWYLRMMLFKTFNRLLDHIKTAPAKTIQAPKPQVTAAPGTKLTVPLGFSDKGETTKVEDVKPVEIEIKIEVNNGALPKVTPVPAKKEEVKKDATQAQEIGDDHNTEDLYAKLYVKSSKDASILTLPKSVVDASLLFAASSSKDMISKMIDVAREQENLFDFWTPEDTLPPGIYTDYGLHTDYDIPIKIRRKLISTNDARLVEFGLRRANPSELVELLQTFALHKETVASIMSNIMAIKSKEQVAPQNRSLFGQVLEYHREMGIAGASELIETLGF